MTEQDKNMSENEANIDTPAEETTEQQAAAQPI